MLELAQNKPGDEKAEAVSGGAGILVPAVSPHCGGAVWDVQGTGGSWEEEIECSWQNAT